MPLISDQLNELLKQKSLLVKILNICDIDATEEETFNTLIPKILNIYGITIFIRVKDSFGTIPIQTENTEFMSFSDSVSGKLIEPTRSNLTESFSPIQIETTEITFSGFGENISSEIV